MRDFSLPPVVEPMRKGGLADSVHELAERDPHFAQLARRAAPAGGDPAGGVPAGGEWATVTAAAFRDEVRTLAKGLLADGIRFDDRVAVMARTRYEWTLLSYALWTIGAQVVPVYPTSSAEQVRWILADAQVAAVVVEHEEHAMTVGSVCDAAPSLRRIWQLDTGCLRELTELGRGVPDDLVDRHRLAVTPRSVAAVTYTSGTTGRPKGCVITHANLAAECDILLAGWPGLIAAQGERPAILAFLPLSHIYGLMVQVFCIRNGVLLGHQPEIAPAELLPALASFRPTFVFAVPYVFEKIYRKARQAALEAGKGEVFDRAMDVAVRYAEAVEQHNAGTGPGPGPVLRASHALFDRTVYRKLRAVLGGQVRYAVSGGSTLRRELGLIFAGAGITVYDGYGLTETTAAVTGQPMGRVKFGTVGRPMPGHSIHIARDGEIWVHGDVVFAGYLNNPEATARVLRDGWFATGDVGHLDDEGYLVITGRKKDIIITSGGKSVAPQVLEDRVRAHPLISQCLVVGDDRPYVAALVTLDPEALEHWFRLREREPLSPREVLRDEELHAEVQRAVSKANNAVSRAESIRAFRILPAEFSMREGLVTPSLKMRRAAITKMYEAEIEALYSS